MKPVRIATRRSALALWQARYVATRIEEELGAPVELLPLSTSGDRLRGPLAVAGGKGLFVKEIEQALLDGRADVAVHSGKDLPAHLPPELPIVAVPPREDARDALLAARVLGEFAGEVDDRQPGPQAGASPSRAASTRGGDMGSWVKRLPVAAQTALATQASGGTMGDSPTPRTP